jgi:hypothetical protein
MRQATWSDYHGSAPRIGAAPHRRRNRWLFAGLIAAAALIGGYYALVGWHDARELGQLDAFRAAYAQRCDARFAEPAARIVEEQYFGSSALQAEVDRQLAALQRGDGCTRVSIALKQAGFPLPAPAAAPAGETPTITLEPGER